MAIKNILKPFLRHWGNVKTLGRMLSEEEGNNV